MDSEKHNRANKSGNETTIIESILSLVKNIIQNGKNDGQPENHTFWVWRFLSAWFGCAVLHLALYISNTYTKKDTILNFINDFSSIGYLFALGVVSTYCAFFALIVAFGSPQGTIIRHFIYGIFLPSTSYLLANYVL